MWKNKHLVVATLVAPMAWFAVDYMVAVTVQESVYFAEVPVVFMRPPS